MAKRLARPPQLAIRWDDDSKEDASKLGDVAFPQLRPALWCAITVSLNTWCNAWTKMHFINDMHGWSPNFVCWKINNHSFPYNKFFKEIKDLILKDLTLWELNLDGNICPVPGISVDTYGATGGYVLNGYKPGTRYIDFSSDMNYHQEIARAFVEEIKQNSQDWKI